MEEVIQKLFFHRRDGEVAPARGAGVPRAGSKQPLEKLGPSIRCPVSRALPWEESSARPDSLRLRWAVPGSGARWELSSVGASGGVCLRQEPCQVLSEVTCWGIPGGQTSEGGRWCGRVSCLLRLNPAQCSEGPFLAPMSHDVPACPQLGGLLVCLIALKAAAVKIDICFVLVVSLPRWNGRADSVHPHSRSAP